MQSVESAPASDSTSVALSSRHHLHFISAHACGRARHASFSIDEALEEARKTAKHVAAATLVAA